MKRDRGDLRSVVCAGAGDRSHNTDFGRTRSNCVELGQTRTNSNTSKTRGRIRQKPMNYGAWSKSNELERTLTPNFVLRDDGQTEEKIFEQKGAKVAK